MSSRNKVLLRAKERSYKLQDGKAGMTLVEILVVLAIIAALAAIIYPSVVDSLKKSQAAMIAQRLDAIQKAKVQYEVDLQTSSSGLPPDKSQVSIDLLLPYLTRFGVPIKNMDDLNQGTGGSFNLGTWGSNPYFAAAAGTTNEYIAKYNIPTAPIPSAASGN